jgi:uncharacterized protein (DUF849 family)
MSHYALEKSVTGKPDQTPEAFGRFLPRIKQMTNAVVNLTTGGAPYMTVQERIKPAETFQPEVASLNMGSMNFGLFPMLNRFKEFKHDWEAQALENSRDLVFRNTFKDIEFAAHCRMAVRFEIQCPTPHISITLRISDRGWARAALRQSVFGIWRHRPAHRRMCCT